ncbi:beta-lactamase/transpeptidase-like protein [Triangularia setosa]|uniref:Beta-lactamase/transpeptidase-like protein n=1 Tax=Triangularia setosa TaxID=2587417 RepID=A0AAN6W3B7_9PEZI|nr:beta-lactamase/transpeptidase-like protein [Podospora setosa]
MVSTRHFLLAALALGASALPATAPVQIAQRTSPSAASVDEAFSAAVKEKRVPGIAAIALNRDGSVLYKNSWGTVNIDDESSAPVTSSTKMNIASMTKSIVAVAALQLVEQDKLSLDDFVEDYYPEWKNISVLDGFTDDGEPILRAPKTKATILHLITHTAGQGYWFLDEDIAKWTEWSNTQDTNTPTPLAADPGAGWFYGSNIDTLGYVIEAISGLRLDDYIEYNIFKPLGIKNSGFIQADMYTHRRHANGTITATAAPAPISPTAKPGGGGYLISTIDDYSTYLLALINWGTHPQSGATILKSSTIRKYVFADLIHAVISGDGSCGFKQQGPPVGVWESNVQTMSLSSEFLPGTKKGWSASFLINNEDIPGRRKANSGAWAGINNLFYWVDVKSGKLGAVFTNLQPFLDPEVLGLFDKLEEFVYAA